MQCQAPRSSLSTLVGRMTTPWSRAERRGLNPDPLISPQTRPKAEGTELTPGFPCQDLGHISHPQLVRVLKCQGEGARLVWGHRPRDTVLPSRAAADLLLPAPKHRNNLAPALTSPSEGGKTRKKRKEEGGARRFGSRQFWEGFSCLPGPAVMDSLP